jgi:membrane protein DedA with SNARE-associated domain
LNYKYTLLFPLAVVEGPILAVLAGWLCTTGLLNPLICYPLIVAGDITGDTICYMLGRWGGSVRYNGIRKLLGLRPGKIERVHAYFDRHPVRTISLSKLMLGIGVAGILMAGNAKIPYLKFLGICVLTSAGQYIVYLGIGLFFGEAYTRINQYLNYFASAAIVAAVAAILFFSIKSMRKKI